VVRLRGKSGQLETNICQRNFDPVQGTTKCCTEKNVCFKVTFDLEHMNLTPVKCHKN